jgi:4-aminobutyrate aminotransferase-like enzyme
VIDEIARLGLVRNAELMGAALRKRLDGLMSRHPIIGDVRGQGLLMAFEFMADRTTKAPLPAHLNAHQRLVDIAYEMGLIVYSRRTRDGVEGDHIMVCPPLIATEQHLNEITQTLDAALTRLAHDMAPTLSEMA